MIAVMNATEGAFRQKLWVALVLLDAGKQIFLRQFYLAVWKRGVSCHVGKQRNGIGNMLGQRFDRKGKIFCACRRLQIAAGGLRALSDLTRGHAAGTELDGGCEQV